MKLSQYADDTCLFLKDEEQVEPVLRIIKDFGIFAGPKLNIQKTEGIWLGTKKYRQANCSLGNIKWPTDPIRCLGIYIGTDYKKCEFLNWWCKLQKIENQLKLWKMRNLSLIGKVTVVKHLIIPKLLFSCQFFEFPIGFVKQLESIVYEYIWGSRDKIKRNTFISDIQDGGLQMVDFESKAKSMRATWMCKIHKDDSQWSFFGNNILCF